MALQARPRERWATVLPVALSGILCAMSTLHLLWLLCDYAPTYLVVFESFLFPIPADVRFISAVSHWVMMLRPLIVLVLVGLIVVLAMGTFATIWGNMAPAPRVLRSLAALLLVASVVTTASSFAIVHSLHSVHDRFVREKLLTPPSPRPSP
jgi:hypothetical protein